MKATIHITLKSGVLDPQGKAISHALQDMGFDEVKKARQGKIIELEIKEGSDDKRLEEMCEKLLANPVIEDYKIEIAS
jgi:phosphoribosylformylglycinamidine synthase